MKGELFVLAFGAAAGFLLKRRAAAAEEARRKAEDLAAADELGQEKRDENYDGLGIPIGGVYDGIPRGGSYGDFLPQALDLVPTRFRYSLVNGRMQWLSWNAAGQQIPWPPVGV